MSALAHVAAVVLLGLLAANVVGTIVWIGLCLRADHRAARRRLDDLGRKRVGT